MMQNRPLIPYSEDISAAAAMHELPARQPPYEKQCPTRPHVQPALFPPHTLDPDLISGWWQAQRH